MTKIDFHAHILPKCDHGSDSRKTSIEQLKQAKKADIGVICATSHFYAQRENVDRFIKRRTISYTKLKETIGDSDYPRLLLGAEILAFTGIDRMPDLEQLCLEGTNILLIEMPFCDWPDGVADSVINLSRDGRFKVVLAHVERYSKDDIEELFDYGLVGQLNVDCLSGLMLKKHIRDWILQGKIVALGSDIHGSKIGYKCWNKATKKRTDLVNKILTRTEELF